MRRPFAPREPVPIVMSPRLTSFLGACLVFGGCYGQIHDRADGARDAVSDRAANDAIADAVRDVRVEAATDAPADDVVSVLDAPIDSAMDEQATTLDVTATMDATPEASFDAGPDVAADSGTDTPIGPVDAGPSSTRHTARTIGWMGAPNGFYEYLPPTYEGTTPHPLLVFWHGIGENGNGSTELSYVLRNGPPRLIENDRWPNDRPFVVLSAQHSGGGCPTSDEIHAFITWALANYRVDTRRVFLTGLSCGAIGSWQYITWNGATQIAAAVLVAGDPGDPTASWTAWGHSMCGLGDLAIWAVHGDSDPTVNYGNENITMNNLLACPSPPRRETHWNVIAGAGHDTWTSTYDLTYGFDIYDFLLRNPHP